jgi:hypothetical protein
MDGRAERPSERARASQISQFMSDERKTLEERAQMTDIERLRHSASHVLAFCHSERSEAQPRNLSIYV